MGAAVARAALDVIKDEGLAARAERLGTQVMNRLSKASSSVVEDVRGRGLLIGIEIKKEVGPARPFCEALMKRGLLCKETHAQVIRLAPPLNIDEDDLGWAVDEILEVLG